MTVPDDQAERPTDLVARDFSANRPTELWVADCTYVASWETTTYVAFVIDVFSRRIVGWRGGALDAAFAHARHDRDGALVTRPRGVPVGAGMVFHSDAGSQFTSFAFTRQLIDAGVDPSIGSDGDHRTTPAPSRRSASSRPR